MLGRGLSRKNILLENKDQEFAWCVCNKPLRSKIPARDRIVPRAEDRGNNAHRQILLRFPKAVHAGAETGESDLWSGIHFSETRPDHFFMNLPTVVAAPL